MNRKAEGGTPAPVPANDQFALNKLSFSTSKIGNILATVDETKDHTGRVVSDSVYLDIAGLSETSVGHVAVENLPPGSGEKLIQKLKSSGNGSAAIVPPEGLLAFLAEAEKLGGHIFADNLGRFHETIVSSYRKILATLTDQQVSYELLGFHIEKGQWSELKGNLIEYVQDPRTFVWIKAETSLKTSQALDDKIGYVIKKILKKEEVRKVAADQESHKATEMLQKIVEESWENERGVSIDLRIIHPIYGEHYTVDKAKVLMLVGKGFVFSVVDGNDSIKSDLYERLLDTRPSDPLSFALKAVAFGIERNEELCEGLFRKHDELEWKVSSIGFGELLKSAPLAADIQCLVESARYIRDQSEDYIEAIDTIGDAETGVDLKNKIAEALAYARDVHQTAVNLYEDNVELRSILKEKRGDAKDWLEYIVAVATIPLVTIVSVAPVWKDFDTGAFSLVGVACAVTAALAFFAYRLVK